MVVGGLVGIAVAAVLWGASKLVGRTKNKVDDAIVAVVRANAPAIVAALERAIGPSKPPARDRVVDHRKQVAK